MNYIVNVVSVNLFWRTVTYAHHPADKFVALQETVTFSSGGE